MTAPTSQDLGKQLLEQAKVPNPVSVRKVDPSRQAAIQYQAFLRKVIQSVYSDIKADIVPLLRQLEPEYVTDGTIATMDAYLVSLTTALDRLARKYSSTDFKTLAENQAKKLMEQMNYMNRKRFNSQMRSFGIDVYGDSQAVNDLLEAAVYNNAKLIESIPNQYIESVSNTILTNVRSGNRASSIIKSITDKIDGPPKKAANRAALIARDQTAKVNGELNQKRQVSSGFEYFKWDDSDDSRVRPRHETIANKITAYGPGVYRWDNPPLSDSGQPITPGEDYNCRCVAIPVSAAQVDRYRRGGQTRKGVYR